MIDLDAQSDIERERLAQDLNDLIDWQREKIARMTSTTQELRQANDEYEYRGTTRAHDEALRVEADVLYRLQEYERFCDLPLPARTTNRFRRLMIRAYTNKRDPDLFLAGFFTPSGVDPSVEHGRPRAVPESFTFLGQPFTVCRRN